MKADEGECSECSTAFVRSLLKGKGLGNKSASESARVYGRCTAPADGLNSKVVR